jgi:hypothetical protein
VITPNNNSAYSANTRASSSRALAFGRTREPSVLPRCSSAGPTTLHPNAKEKL